MKRAWAWGPAVALAIGCGGLLDEGPFSEAPAAPRPIAASSCDVVANVSPSGANPEGRWSYGASQALGSPFGLYGHYFANAIGYKGLLDAWSAASEVGLDNPTTCLPGAFYNPFSTPVQLRTLTARPGQFFLHPGPQGQYSIARWTAPLAGTYAVQAVFEGIDIGPTTTDVHVQHNGVDAAPAGYINVNGGANSVSFATTVTITAGDTIDFAVGHGGNGFNNDSTALAASVCPASAEPSPR
jgi:hypothetical protein